MGVTNKTNCTQTHEYLTIDAKERRDVATLDIPGTFLQTDAKPKTIFLIFHGEMGGGLIRIDPK